MNEIMNIRLLRCFNNLIQWNILPAVVTIGNILSNRHIEKNWFLRNDSN